MTLTEDHIETLKDSPFIIGRFPGLAHELCRMGLMEWVDKAWRLTDAGQAALSARQAERSVAA